MDYKKMLLKHTTKRLVLAVLLLLGPLFAASAQNTTSTYKLYSIFMYKFSQYVQWPTEYSGEDFIIGVVGKSNIISELDVMAKTKKVAGKNISVRYFAEYSNLEYCHIVFLSDAKVKDLENVITKIGSNPTLLVTETPGLANKGSMINFDVKDKRIILELNQKNIQKAKLKVSSSLLKVASVVG